MRYADPSYGLRNIGYGSFDTLRMPSSRAFSSAINAVQLVSSVFLSAFVRIASTSAAAASATRVAPTAAAEPYKACATSAMLARSPAASKSASRVTFGV